MIDLSLYTMVRVRVIMQDQSRFDANKSTHVMRQAPTNPCGVTWGQSFWKNNCDSRELQTASHAHLHSRPTNLTTSNHGVHDHLHNLGAPRLRGPAPPANPTRRGRVRPHWGAGADAARGCAGRVGGCEGG